MHAYLSSVAGSALGLCSVCFKLKIKLHLKITVQVRDLVESRGNGGP